MSLGGNGNMNRFVQEKDECRSSCTYLNRPRLVVFFRGFFMFTLVIITEIRKFGRGRSIVTLRHRASVEEGKFGFGPQQT